MECGWMCGRVGGVGNGKKKPLGNSNTMSQGTHKGPILHHKAKEKTIGSNGSNRPFALRTKKMQSFITTFTFHIIESIWHTLIIGTLFCYSF